MLSQRKRGLVSQGGDSGGQAAISELIKEATLLSSMRHPNVVWVYGIVLKPMTKDDGSDDDELNDRDGGQPPYPHVDTYLGGICNTCDSQGTWFSTCQWCHAVFGFPRCCMI